MKALLGFILLVAGAAAEPLDAFSPLVGRWEADGRFLGAKATAHYAWERALGGRVVILRYQVTRAGKTVFEGHGYYRADGSGTWHDSEGHAYAIAWKATSAGVSSEWGDGGTSDYESAGRVIDRMKGKTFAEFQLRRAP